MAANTFFSWSCLSATGHHVPDKRSPSVSSLSSQYCTTEYWGPVEMIDQSTLYFLNRLLRSPNGPIISSLPPSLRVKPSALVQKTLSLATPYLISQSPAITCHQKYFFYKEKDFHPTFFRYCKLWKTWSCSRSHWRDEVIWKSKNQRDVRIVAEVIRKSKNRRDARISQGFCEDFGGWGRGLIWNSKTPTRRMDSGCWGHLKI